MITEELVHIKDIKPGDAIVHYGELRTVCRSNIKRGFMGITLFGDSYRLGQMKVIRAVYHPAQPDKK